MTYRFELQDASLTEAMRRIVRQEITPILGHLQEDHLAPTVVHDIRKRVKKLRALLRLVRPGMRDVQAAENVILRDAGQALSGSRDAAVRLATFDRLISGNSDSAILALRAHLVAEAAMPARRRRICGRSSPIWRIAPPNGNCTDQTAASWAKVWPKPAPVPAPPCARPAPPAATRRCMTGANGPRITGIRPGCSPPSGPRS